MLHGKFRGGGQGVRVKPGFGGVASGQAHPGSLRVLGPITITTRAGANAGTEAKGA